LKILVIQLRSLGDILCTTPVLAYLKSALPHSEIDFLSEPVGTSVLETNPHLHEILVYDKAHPLREIKRIRSRRYDAVLDFMNNPRTAYITAFSRARWQVHFYHWVRSLFYNLAVPVPIEPEYVPLRKLRMVRTWLEKAGLPTPPVQAVRPQIFLTKEDENFAAQWIKAEGLEKKKYVILVPVHKYPICRWRPEGFQKVGQAISQKNFKVYLAWGPGEEKDISDIRQGYEGCLGVRPPAEVRKIGAVFKRAQLVVANNSGAMHLAVSVGTPTVTIYGPTRPIDWNPSLSGAQEKLQDIPLTASGVPCLGCRLKKCPVGHLCMTRLSEEAVLAACDGILNRGD
jgi:ADP-heptose:LPS heptosyltransferase